MCDVTGEWLVLDADTMTDMIMNYVRFVNFQVVITNAVPINDIYKMVYLRRKPSIVEAVSARGEVMNALSAASQQSRDDIRRNIIYEVVRNIYLKNFVIGEEIDGD